MVSETRAVVFPNLLEPRTYFTLEKSHGTKTVVITYPRAAGVVQSAPFVPTTSRLLS